MTKNEKILLLELIMQDIRGNWGWDLGNRVRKCIELAEELRFDNQTERLKYYLNEKISDGCCDGRYLRTNFENGGYRGMGEKHDLQYTYKDKSEEFKSVVDRFLTYPEYRFKDREE